MTKTYKGLQHALAALEGLDPQAQRRLLKTLAQKDPQLAQRLELELFQFQDLVKLSKQDFKICWFEIPKVTWHLALRAAPGEVISYLKRCLTERAYDQLAEDLKALGPQPVSKVLDAQKEIMLEIQTLASKGKIKIAPKT